VIAVVPVREGRLPAGGAETVAEAGGRAFLVGAAAGEAVGQLAGIARSDEPVRVWDTPGFAPRAWAEPLADVLRNEPVIVLPASPDGRDLAPHLAHALGRPLLAGAVEVAPHGAALTRHGGLVIETTVVDGPFVATLQPGVRGVELGPHEDLRTDSLRLQPTTDVVDATIVAIDPPDVTTMDLAEAARIVGGGGGLDSAERFVQLRAIGRSLSASMGATRVVTDRHWVSHERQIGTTGVVVEPEVYVAFGVSGAVQHTSGLGQPDLVISVNTDPACPMMTMADLAIVADANAVLEALAERLGVAGA
jgi:electron transfer flavoprotein alpha subunit